MSLSAAPPCAPALAAHQATATANKKTQGMDKLFLLLDPAAAPQSLLGAHDDPAGAYLLPPLTDGYEAWAYPESQQAVFDDWVAAAAPPPTAAASPSAALLTSPLVLSPALSSPTSSRASTNGSPLITSDIALSLVSTLQHSQQPAALSVADYAALFPDIAAALASPVEACTPFMRSPCASSADLATMSLMGIMEPVSPAASLSETLMGAQSPACETGDDAEELRKRRDREFLASLPPQLALKRRRTSNNKQKEKILAELLQPAEACPAAARRPTVAAAQPAAAADYSEPSDEPAADDEPADAAALKRKKNTDAARRSRMRKILRIETLESRVSELEGENTRLSQLVAQLEAEKAAMARAVL